MAQLGVQSVFYYENIEGGHGGAADNRQRAFMSTLAYLFLDKALSSHSLKPSRSEQTPTFAARLPAPSASWIAPLVGAAVIVALAIVERRAK
eukprot:229030-Pleurochrysis_carterae.AAC.2